MLEVQFSKYTVNGVMSENLLKLEPSEKLSYAVEEMLKNDIPEVLVIRTLKEGEQLLGILTYTDVSALMQQGVSFDKPLSSVALKNVVTGTEEMLLTDARQTIIDQNIGCLPILNGSRITGIIRIANLRDSYYRFLEIVNKQYMAVIHQMHEAVTVTDRDGNVLLWNKNAERIYNMKASEILYKKLEDFFPNALSLSVMKTGIPIENVYHSPKPNYYVIISALPIIVDGEYLGVVATERDVTEYNQLTNELVNANVEIDLLKKEVEKMTKGSFSFGGILGNNAVVQDRIELAKHVAATDTNVMLTGESGTGKEVFARAIHEGSRRPGLFVPVNCSAIPSALFESEFFGYVGGAFTGALRTGKIGFFELANEGTLFLDEIGDLPLEHQAKLLRVLQDGMISKVGAERRTPVDVRVICATNRNLAEMVKAGNFREDLFYRLNVVEIHLPPLRERREDLVLLFNRFLEEGCKKNHRKMPHVDNSVFNALLNYNWPGNIRELRNVVEYMLVVGRSNQLTSESLPSILTQAGMISPCEDRAGEVLTASETLSEVESKVRQKEIEMISKALEAHNGNKKKAAEALNIPRSTLYYKISQYGI
ncbi:sigma 54-interacting transcriptional regulator [Acidaminobacter hydrogenoformans]|uniref:PAS domain S-box-containing protein n=1 Tax=Acidaminobacter hydrogenoformans DSM 2784 TaxID=1120920 RepID=A0A1G5S618_9FIRM|nr:sigma 54-interacting transcriptional regulator [Acidaminobacter hydrogenoformans]SCZ81181.1 PAS domain S-box-containing protein [Acidaminobacter hydrogenoformans DSM 2784]